MARLVDYREVWNTVKAEGSASIVVSKDAAKKENVARRHAGLMYWSKFVITRQSLSDSMVKITFTLLYESKL